MKLKLLAAVATAAIIASGVAAHAQDNPKHDQRPAAERVQPKAETPPRAGEAPKGDAMKGEAPKSADAADQQGPKGAETQRKETPKAGEMKRNEAPKAAETQRKEGPKAAETQHDQQPNQMHRQGEASPAANAPKRVDARDQKGATPGAGNKPHEAQRASGPARVTGKVRMSNEHAQRVGAALRRDARPEHVDINVRVGERIPETVIVRPLPEDVVSIVPEYRGYDYFVDSDDEIVFVSPETHEIVGTIGYEGRAAAEDATEVSGARPCPAND